MTNRTSNPSDTAPSFDCIYEGQLLQDDIVSKVSMSVKEVVPQVAHPINTNDIKDQSDSRPQSVKTVQSVTVSIASKETSPLASAFSAIERQCPDLVDVADWQHAVDDGRRFLVQWGEQAEELGWTADDLFGLHDPPERPASNYRRLSRYDATGLVWLLHGRPVVALTADSAMIGAAGGLTFYRRSAK
jgi:hypothetical protein